MKGKAVTASAGDDSHNLVCADEPPRHLVNGSVATNGNDDVGGAFAGQAFCVAAFLGHEDFGII